MSQKRHKIRTSELQGFKYFKALSGMLESLHDAGRQHDLASNRKLHMDQYMSLLLLYMFNPICTSLRALQIGRMCRLAPNGRRSRRLHDYSADGSKAINLKHAGCDASHRSD